MSSGSFTTEKQITAKQDRIWHALVDPDLTCQYFFGTRVKSEWRQGSGVFYLNPDSSVAAEGMIVEIDRPHRLVTSFTPSKEGGWDPCPNAPPDTVSWQIVPNDSFCQVVLSVQGERAEPLSGSWEQAFSDMKNVVERC